MKFETAHDVYGKQLGDEYVNLAGLQQGTKLAIIQLINLDETVDIYKDHVAQMKSAGKGGEQ